MDNILKKIRLISNCQDISWLDLQVVDSDFQLVKQILKKATIMGQKVRVVDPCLSKLLHQNNHMYIQAANLHCQGFRKSLTSPNFNSSLFKSR